MKFKSDKQRKAVMSQLNANNSSTSKLSKMKKVKQDRKANSREDALAKELKLSKSKLKQSKYDENLYETDDGEEYLVFDNYEDAERRAEERVREDLENEPELFSKDWLSQHTYISDTDKRIIAGEESYNYADNLDDAEIDREISGKESVERKREIYREEKYDEIYKELEHDPEDYFVNQQGFYTHEEYVKQPFVQIDVDSATKDAIQTDGVAHFLSSYDGNEIKKDGYYIYRVN